MKKKKPEKEIELTMHTAGLVVDDVGAQEVIMTQHHRGLQPQHRLLQ